MKTPLAPSAVNFSKYPIWRILRLSKSGGSILRSIAANKLRMRFHASVWVVHVLLAPAAPIAHGADIISNGPVSTVKGERHDQPALFREVAGREFNSLFYILPGEGECRGTEESAIRIRIRKSPSSSLTRTAPGPCNRVTGWTGAGLQWFVDKTNSWLGKQLGMTASSVQKCL